MLRFHAPCLLAAAAWAIASPANAVFFAETAGLAQADQTISFDEVALTQNQSVTTEFQSFGVTYDGAFANPDISAAYPNINGNRLGNFYGFNPARPFVMSFDSALGAVAFSMVTADGQSTFQALRNGVVVETATQATSATSATNFYGFRGILFDQIAIGVSSSDHALLLDNLQTAAPVPEPGSWALMLAGILSLGALARRRVV